MLVGLSFQCLHLLTANLTAGMVSKRTKPYCHLIKCAEHDLVPRVSSTMRDSLEVTMADFWMTVKGNKYLNPTLVLNHQTYVPKLR